MRGEGDWGGEEISETCTVAGTGVEKLSVFFLLCEEGRER